MASTFGLLKTSASDFCSLIVCFDRRMHL